MMFSPSAIDLASYTTASAGHLPMDVSELKIKASAPSSTAEVMSSASCLVHTSEVIIESKI